MPDSVDSAPRVGRYQPIRRLAVGGMAEIHLARLLGVGIEGFEKLVVLKRILPQHALDPELLRMFVDEARLSATLTHPNVTEVYDVGSDGDAPFFAMEYVHGANLREILRKLETRAAGADALPAPLPLEHAIGIVAAAAGGLHYAHERLGPGGDPLDIVHRDVSPSNVLVSYDGAVKVSDFGIAKWAFQRTQTQEGTLKGKFAYMSPEQCRGKAVDRRSDVFALGAILYELTTGTAAFAAPSDFDILQKIVSERAAPPAWPPATAGAPYPPELSAIVMRALAPDPAERFQTMQELQVALESYARAAGIVVSTVTLAAFVQGLFADELAAWRSPSAKGRRWASTSRRRRPGARQPRRRAQPWNEPRRTRSRAAGAARAVGGAGCGPSRAARCSRARSRARRSSPRGSASPPRRSRPCRSRQRRCRRRLPRLRRSRRLPRPRSPRPRRS
jgi:serine/threonine protein kinase